MGLQQKDLRDMVYRILEIDSFSSKMGEDKDIVTLSFSVKEHTAAQDLMNFVEKGYDFVLDADATSGEQADGTYKVFVELERNKKIHDNIMEIMDGVGKLSDKDEWRFRYYKNPYKENMIEALKYIQKNKLSQNSREVVESILN